MTLGMMVNYGMNGLTSRKRDIAVAWKAINQSRTVEIIRTDPFVECGFDTQDIDHGAVFHSADKSAKSDNRGGHAPVMQQMLHAEPRGKTIRVRVIVHNYEYTVGRRKRLPKGFQFLAGS